MLSHIVKGLGPVPKPRSDEPLSLDQIIGRDSAAEIEQSGKIIFQVGGDSGVPDILDRETRQTMVAEAMAKDFNFSKHTESPAFLYHLGDVIYSKPGGTYESEFYKPYKHYPGKIVAIPGNHDGETTEKLRDFQKTFCATRQVVPPEAGVIFRQTMTQPGVYWWLEAPFVDIIGLYSNSAENPGFISGPIPGAHQKNWLIQTLKQIGQRRRQGQRKALLFATHHPPFSNGGHSGSTEMLHDIDDACSKAGDVRPDAFFSGHAHSIQRYTRTFNNAKTPYFVFGCIGHGDQHVDSEFPKASGDHVYEFGYKGYGYGLVTVTQKSLTINAFGVDWDATGKAVSKSIDRPTKVTWS